MRVYAKRVLILSERKEVQRMPYKTPEVFMPLIATVAAVIGALARWKENNMFAKPFKFGVFLFDMLISAGLGLIGFWVVMDLGQPESFAATISAVLGNIGSRVFDMARVLLAKKVEKEIEK